MTAPTVGLALIVRDEEETLPALLASVDGAFDQVVLVDTGSTDQTVKVFQEWVATQDLALGSNVANFKWIDDFAAARTYADSFLKTDWTCWADADDVIQGAENLRALAAQAPPELLGYICGYDYAQDARGNCACYLRRERLVRRGAGEWHDRVHEAQVIRGPQTEVDPNIVLWVHRHPPDASDSNERNLRILRSWAEDEPDNPRVVGYLGTETLLAGDTKGAEQHFRHYVSLKTGWDEERAQIHRKLCMCLIANDRFDEAIDIALEAVRLMPEWPDSYLTLAEAYHHKGEFEKAIYWAEQVQRIGQPKSLLIINPLDYELMPHVIAASAYGALGRIDEAMKAGEQALKLNPDHEGLRASFQTWTAQTQREATAQTYLAAARLLVNHDEQLKALTLLEQTVPHFAQDHAEIVAMRSELRERLLPLMEPAGYGDFYADGGGEKPEELTDDEKIEEIGAYLPRSQFLLRGCLEQAGVAA